MTPNENNIICIESEALYQLVDELAERLLERYIIPEKKWVCSKEAMSLLGIKSDSTLLRLRNEGKLKFSKPTGKSILYNKESIYNYIEEKSFDVF